MAGNGAVRSAAAQGGAGARGRQAGPGLLERPVWSPGTRGGGPGIPSRTVRPGSCQTWLGLARAAGPHLGPLCGRAASRPHTARRRGNGWNSSRGASLGPRGGRGGEGARGTVRRRRAALARAVGSRSLAHRLGPLLWERSPPFTASRWDSTQAPRLSRLIALPASDSGGLGAPPAKRSYNLADQASGPQPPDGARHVGRQRRRMRRLRALMPLLVPAYAFGKP